MSKRIIGIIIPILTCATLIGQDYIMFESQYLELRDGVGHSQLQAGVKKHNNKFHSGNDGTTKAYLWYVNTGPNSGQYTWAVGPTKFSHYDKSLPADHVRDWDNNVEKYARAHTHIFMVRDEDLTYNPENETVGENILMKRLLVKNGQSSLEAVEEAVGSIAKVLRRTRAKIARRVYRSAFRTSEGEIMLVYPFSSWTVFESGFQGLPEGFQKDYERVYGKGSWKKNVADVLEKHTNGVTNEVQTMVK